MTDKDGEVRLRTAQGLLGSQDSASIPALIDLLESSPSVASAWQAEELLRWAVGERSPPEMIRAGDGETRRNCRAAWRKWWEREGQRLDLAKALNGLPPPALVLQSGRHGGRLLGSDGVERWSLRLAHSHIEQLLPEDRILIRVGLGMFDETMTPTATNPIPETRICDLNGRTTWSQTTRGMFARTKYDYPGLVRRRLDGTILWVSSLFPQLAIISDTEQRVRLIDARVLTNDSTQRMRVRGYRDGRLLYGWGSRNCPFAEWVEQDPETGTELCRAKLPRALWDHIPSPLPSGNLLVTPLSSDREGYEWIELDRAGNQMRRQARGYWFAWQFRDGMMFVQDYQRNVLYIDGDHRPLRSYGHLPDIDRARPVFELIRLGSHH